MLTDFFFLSLSILVQYIFLDAARLQPQRTITDEKQRLAAAIRGIRSLDGFHSAPIVFIPEDGPPGAGEKLFDHVRGMGQITCMTEAGSVVVNAQHRFGVPKTEASTRKMVDMAIEMISAGAIQFSTNLFSLSHHDRGEDVAATLDKLKFQMFNYRINVKVKKTENNNDDLLIAVLQCLVWSKFFFDNRSVKPQYKEFWQTCVKRGKK